VVRLFLPAGDRRSAIHRNGNLMIFMILKIILQKNGEKLTTLTQITTSKAEKEDHIIRFFKKSANFSQK
jgi:hypothetical protein